MVNGEHELTELKPLLQLCTRTHKDLILNFSSHVIPLQPLQGFVFCIQPSRTPARFPEGSVPSVLTKIDCSPQNCTAAPTPVELPLDPAPLKSFSAVLRIGRH